jgi:peroxiredoxin Q/BCP
MKTRIGLQCFTVCLLTIAALPARAEDGVSIRVATKLSDFALTDLDGKLVSLSTTLQKGPAVLVVLRGWPGYQCPFCTRQFGEFLSHAQDFAKYDATVLFVYPGPAAGLAEHAREFRAERPLPPHFRFLVDRDMRWLTEHGLRWKAEGETSYPSTLVLDRQGEVRFAITGKVHGARASTAQLLEVLGELHR